MTSKNKANTMKPGTLNSAQATSAILADEGYKNESTIADLKVLKLNNATSYVIRDLPPEWSPWSGSNRCPKCGSHNIEVNNRVVLTSNPPQSQLRCKECNYHFGSGIFSRNTDEDTLNKIHQDQSILNISKEGDSPYAPQVGEWPPYTQPWEQEPPSYPDVYIPRKESPVGWICPKCGKCWAPHIDSCSCSCSSTSSSIKVTY